MGREPIATEQNAMTVTAAVKADAPILSLINTDLSSQFGSESGDTVSARIPAFGKVNEGIALPTNVDDYALNIKKIPVQVTPKNNPVNYDFVESSLSVGNFEQNVAIPYGANLASYIRKEAFDAILGGATRQIVLSSLDALNFDKMAQAIASVQDSNIGGAMGCVLSNRMEAALVNKGLNQFQNGSVAYELWKGKIKNFDGTNFVSQSEVARFKTPNITTATVAAAVGEGVDRISVNFAALPAGTIIPAGYVFKIAGINSVDIFKKDDNYERAFVVIKDAIVPASGPTSLEISPIWASNNALKNATALPKSGDNLVLVLQSNKTYMTGAVFSKTSTAYASAAIKEAAGVDSAVSTVEGFVNVRMTAQYDIKLGINIVRFDMLTGAKSLYGQGITGLWVGID